MNWQSICPEFLKKRLFRHLLHYFVGDFFKEKLSLEQLFINFYHGTASVENLHLDCEFINQKLAKSISTLPIEIVTGFVGSISVYIPWHDIKNQDCILTIKDIQIILKIKPLKQTNSTNTSLIESVIETTSSLTKSIMNESLHLTHEYIQNETDFSTESLLSLDTLSSLITSILARVKIKLENTYLRIEPSVNLNSLKAFEFQIKIINYSEIDSLTRLFKVNDIKAFLDESQSVLVDLDESVANTNPIQIINIENEALFYLKINKTSDTSQPILELSIEIDEIKSNLTPDQINFLNELFRDLNGTLIPPKEFAHNLNSSQNDIYYSFISNESQSRRNSMRNNLTESNNDEFKQMLNSIDEQFKTYSFNARVKRFDLELRVCETNAQDYLRLVFESFQIVINQKENTNQSIKEANLSILGVILSEANMLILDASNEQSNMILVEFESLVTKESFKKYENVFVKINNQILINLTEVSFKKILNLYENIRLSREYSSKNECIKSLDLISNDSIRVRLNLNDETLLINLLDFHLNKFNDLNVNSSEMSLSFKSANKDQLREFLKVKHLDLTLEINSNEISLVKFKKLDSSMPSINLESNSNTQLEEYGPFSKVASLISNESNTQIVRAGTKLEIEEFINQSLKHSNSSLDFKIDNAQLLIYDQEFLSSLFSTLVNFKSILTRNKSNKPNYSIKTTILICVKSASLKAYLHSDDFTEFYSDLTSINFCLNCLFRTQQISLQIDQANLACSASLAQPDYNFPLVIANNSNVILDINNYYRDISNSMITLAVKFKPSKILTSLNFDYFKLIHRFSKVPSSFWLNQLLFLFSLIRLKKTPIQSELHLNISNSCVEYKPLYLEIKSTVSIKSLHFTKSNTNELILVLIEEIKLFLAKNYLNVCVAQIDQFELSSHTKQRVFKLASNLVHIKTCVDSVQNLIRLIKYVCQSGDFPCTKTTPNDLKTNLKEIRSESLEQAEDVELILSDYNLIESYDQPFDDSVQTEEFLIKCISSRTSFTLIEDYFKKPETNDPFKPPNSYPNSSETYLVELSIKWSLFKGLDFQANDNTRDTSEHMQISVNKLKFRLDFYHDCSFFYRCSLGVGEAKIKDNLSGSPYDLFMYRYEADHCPRRNLSPMFFVKFVCYEKITKSDMLDCECKLSIQPLRFNFDQDTLLFLYQFFNNSLSEWQPAANLDKPDRKFSFNLRRFIFSSDLIVKFDFNGKYDANCVSNLNRLLLPAVQLSNTEIKFKKLILKQIRSDELIWNLKQVWLNDIKQSQVMNIIRGWSLFNSAILVINGFICLIAYPIEHCHRNGRLIYGIQKGSSAFSTCTMLATVESTSQLVCATKSIGEYFYGLITFNRCNNCKKRSLHSFNEGFMSNALTALNHNLSQTATNLINDLSQNKANIRNNCILVNLPKFS